MHDCLRVFGEKLHVHVHALVRHTSRFVVPEIRFNFTRCAPPLSAVSPAQASEKLPDIGRTFEYLLNTGNLLSKSGLDLSQATGFTVSDSMTGYEVLGCEWCVSRGV